MFDWPLFFLLTAITIPGIAIVVPKLIGELLKDKDIPAPLSRLKVAGFTQSLVLIVAAAAFGVWFTAEYEVFRAPFFEAVLTGRNVLGELGKQLVPALLGGGIGGLLFVGAYYGIFRRRIDSKTLRITEHLRGQLGIWGRIFYGGIFEEVLTRWGLQSLVLWILILLFDSLSVPHMWFAIVFTGILFGLGHLPGAKAAGAQLTPVVITSAIVLNLWGSLIFGWLLITEGLLAAMIAHALFHLVWYPFEKKHNH